MNLNIFTYCFEKLCLQFDLDPEKKKNRIPAYFDSKLGEMQEHKFLELIKKAGETLTVKTGFLPSKKELTNLYFNTMTTKKQKPLGENFHDAICFICNGIGLVSKDTDHGRVCLGCCTCIIGQKKQHDTILGRELGCYKKDVVPF